MRRYRANIAAHSLCRAFPEERTRQRICTASSVATGYESPPRYRRWNSHFRSAPAPIANLTDEQHQSCQICHSLRDFRFHAFCFPPSSSPSLPWPLAIRLMGNGQADRRSPPADSSDLKPALLKVDRRFGLDTGRCRFSISGRSWHKGALTTSVVILGFCLIFTRTAIPLLAHFVK
jgi:hypothetical protein